MFIESIGTISNGISIYEFIRKEMPTFNKFWQLIRTGKIKIAILGTGGVGKSTLGNFLSDLSEKNNQIIVPQPYKESIGIENYKFKDYPTVTLIVPPGQERREYTWDDRLNLKQYYQERTYEEYIQKITAKQGINNFRHEYLSASLLTLSGLKTLRFCGQRRLR